jgi:hypothetical protein
MKTLPLRPNMSIDTDVLSGGFTGLLSAGHLRRYMALAVPERA